jgi:soluble lytic murein transglycosylase-like protein
MFDSNLKLVLASYNAGEGAVKKYHNSIPPYPETRDYVRKVLKLYQKL